MHYNFKMSKNTTFDWVSNQCASNPKETREDIQLSDVFITIGELNEFLTEAISKNPDVKDFKLIGLERGLATDINSIVITFNKKVVYVSG